METWQQLLAALLFLNLFKCAVNTVEWIPKFWYRLLSTFRDWDHVKDSPVVAKQPEDKQQPAYLHKSGETTSIKQFQ